MASDDQETKRQAVLEEYYVAQSAANDIDRQTQLFKNWSIGVSVALFSWAFGRSEALPMLAPCVAALLFWYCEGLWKEKVKIFTNRVRDLEKMLHGELDIREYRGPLFYEMHRNYYKGGQEEYFPNRLRYVSVMMPHVIVVILSVLLWLYRVLSG